MLSRVWDLLFPEKCVLCQKVLEKGEQDLCRTCRMGLEAWHGGKKTIPFVASWTALWYYEGNVRESLLRYKFGGRESYARSYGRLLAMTLLEEDWTYDRITWVPISRRRKLRRGYDQVELLARAAAKELGREAEPVLRKLRHNPP